MCMIGRIHKIERKLDAALVKLFFGIHYIVQGQARKELCMIGRIHKVERKLDVALVKLFFGIYWSRDFRRFRYAYVFV